MFEFGKRSLSLLDSAHKDLQLIMVAALSSSDVDFGITQTTRSFHEQLQYFLDGNSRIDPRIPEQAAKSKHMKEPAEAVDIYIHVKGRRELAYDKLHCCYVAGIIMTAADYLKTLGTISHNLTWGGNWDKDGTIIYDHKLDDLVHFELDT